MVSNAYVVIISDAPPVNVKATRFYLEGGSVVFKILDEPVAVFAQGMWDAVLPYEEPQDAPGI